jgi:hypothetical protein
MSQWPRRTVLGLAVAILAAAPLPAIAQAQTTAVDLLTLSLEELLSIKVTQ